MRQLARWLSPLLLLLAVAAPAHAAPREEAAPAPVNTYTTRSDIHYMAPHAAEVLAWEQCPDALKSRCAVVVTALAGDPTKRAVLEMTADSATHERVARALAKADSSPRTQVFQIVLLAASNRPGIGAAELTPGAQKALADIRGFLPFKGYEQLDAALLRSTQIVEGRLVGRKGEAYDVWLRFQQAGNGSAGDDLFLDSFRLRDGGKELISTSFGLKQGETIVVGTSKTTGGDEALVVLLTAVP